MSQIVFACHSKACAPPPAGKGGSIKGNASPRVREEYRSIINQSRQMHGDNPHGQPAIVSVRKGRVSSIWEVAKRGADGKWSTKKGYQLERSAAVQKALDAFLSPN